MIRNAVIIGLGATLLAACVPVQPPQGPKPPAAAEPTSPADMTAKFEPPEGQPLAPVDVRKLTCKTLSGSSDDDKAYATSFLLGYRSALIHSHTIEIKRIEAVEEAALADCATKPDALATKVFAATLAKIGPGGEIREPAKVHHREPPSQATPGTPTPGQQPPGPTHAPIEYTPVQTAPTPVQPAPGAPVSTQQAPSQAEPSQASPTPAATTPAAPTQTATPPAAPTQAAPAAAAPAEAPPPAQPPSEEGHQ
jgi:hypothetical protein